LPAGEIIAIVDAFLPNAIDAFAASQLTGLLLVVSVRDWELRFKKILSDYARSCHSRFGDYMDFQLKNLNGRIKISDITEHLGRMGQPCKESFVTNHLALSQRTIQASGFDAVDNYNSVVLNRHSFVHEGSLTLTFADAKLYCQQGELVLECLKDTLDRLV